MKRFLLACFCMAFPLRGQEATNAAAPPQPGYRFLFLIDTSSGMSGQKTVTIDTVSRLILSGIGGRVRVGDAWNLWTFDDQLRTNAIPVQQWDPEQRGDVANRIYRYLRDQRFNKKKALLQEALAAAAEEAKRSGDLAVFLFTDGTKPLKGTPFDQSINEIFAKHGAAMRKAKKPFVTVFVAQDGRFAAHAVSPAGERIYIPPLPQAMAAAKKPVATENEAPVSRPAKTLTAEEISELLRQSQQRQSNTLATTPAPLIIRGGASQTNPVAPNTSSKAAVETPDKVAVETPDRAAVETPGKAAVETPGRATVATPAPAPAAPAPAPAPAPVLEGSVSPDRSAAVLKPSPVTAPTAQARIEPVASQVVNASNNAIAQSTPPGEQPPVATPETSPDDTGEAIAQTPASVQTAVLAQPPQSNNPIYLVAAIALLLVAFLIVWLYIRSIRYIPRPSLISRSLEKERK